MISVEQALVGVTTLFLDTAPIIYFVEGKQSFAEVARPIFRKLVLGELKAVISPVTLIDAFRCN